MIGALPFSDHRERMPFVAIQRVYERMPFCFAISPITPISPITSNDPNDPNASNDSNPVTPVTP
jgi:hypothetical protein